jgi:F-type H+-transporting ATPase subunit delta
MSSIAAYHRYSGALIGLAQERNVLEEVKNDIQLIDETIRNSRELRQMIKSPIVRIEEKLKVLKAIFGERVQTLTKEFVILLGKKGREQDLPGICRAFMEQYREIKGIHQMKITTASPLQANVREHLVTLVSKRVGAKSLEVTEMIDPEIIGGIVLEMDNQKYEASLRGDLAKLKKEFELNLYLKDY